MFPLEKSSTVKCDYCGFVASSVHELLTRHTCYRTLHARNVAQRSSRMQFRPSVINKRETQALRSSRLLPARQNNLKNNISKDIINDLRGKTTFMMNPSKVHYGFRPLVTSSYSPQSVSSSPWDKILDESEIPVPVLEYERENKFNDEILDESGVPIPVPKYMRKNEFLNERYNSLRNNKNIIPRSAAVYQRFPSNSSLERITSPRPLFISPVNSNHASPTQLTSSFYNTEPLNVDAVFDSKLVSESSSELMHVMLVSSINKEIIIVSLDNVMNEIESRMEQLPYEIKIQLEHEFLKKLHDSVDEERKRLINAV